MRHLKYPMLTLWLFFNALPASAQETEKFSRNTFFAEINYSPDMDVYALLYDRILKPKGPVRIGFQTGFAFSLSVDQGDKGFMGFFPIKGYLLMGKTTHFLETGLGLKISGIPYPDFNIGYRYKSVDKGFSFRIGYAGLAFFNGFNSMFGASAGYAF